MYATVCSAQTGLVLSATILKTNKNLLMVSDAFLDNGSGATAARRIALLWRDLGFEVTVFAPVGSGIPNNETASFFRFVPKPSFRSMQHFQRSETADVFEKLVRELSPRVVFFLGTVYSNPLPTLNAALRSGARTIFMSWNQSFYCAKSYAYLHDGPCSRCGNGNYLPAVLNSCERFFPALFSAVARRRIQKALKQVDVLLCSSADQAERLVAFGIEPKKVHQCRLFFDKSRLKNVSIYDGDYFIYYAQPEKAKGWHLIPRIIESVPTASFILCPTNDRQAALANAPGLEKLIDSQRVVLHTGMSWRNGLSELIGRARGVIIPSIWPTTTEYVLLEALGLGKPIVAFNVGVHSEVLRNGVNAMVAPVPDTAKFAQAISTLNTDASLRRAIGIEGRNLYDKLTDEDAILNALNKAIQ